MKRFKKIISLSIALIMALALSVPAWAVNDTIDTSKKGSMEIYKYDITSAEADGAWDASSYVSSGVYDSAVNEALGGATNYAIQGVKFTYAKVADITTYNSFIDGIRTNMILYGMPSGTATEELLRTLGLSYDNAHHQLEGVYYFTSDTLIAGLSRALAANATDTKNALESFIASNGGVTMPETDQYGHTSASNLDLGLYLIVETSVPENVTCTTDPFLASVPMTTINGEEWVYDVVLYPKNNTGSPTLEKTLRETVSHTGKNNGSTDDINDGYAHTGTGSDGDVVDYQIISTLPAITSVASQLSTYTFVDNLSKGITYNKDDVAIEFFRDAACTESIAVWNQSDGKFNVAYSETDAGSTMTISMTESGLTEINTSPNVYGTSGAQRGYSACTMRITYRCTVNSDAIVVYGDSGNPNDLTLTWQRSNTDYYDTLKDDCHFYTYGIDLLKEFSDGAGDYAQVQMVVHNDTDNYYVQAEMVDGVYYVTGHVENEADATVFTPLDKKITLKGVEDDEYTITEINTDAGYTLLKDPIKIVITTAAGEVCDVCHQPLLTASATVNGEAADMVSDGESAHAFVTLSVTNTKGFDLPQTGGNGIWIYTTIGILVMAAAAAAVFYFIRRRPSRR